MNDEMDDQELREMLSEAGLESMTTAEFATVGAKAMTDFAVTLREVGVEVLTGPIQPEALRAWVVLIDAMTADDDPDTMPPELGVARMFARGLDAFFREMEQVEAMLEQKKGEFGGRG